MSKLSKIRERERSVFEDMERLPHSLSGYLNLTESLWPDRLIVLPSAYDSSRGFPIDEREAWLVLKTMATTLWNLLFNGDFTDEQIQKVYSESSKCGLSLTETPITMRTPECIRSRTFEYKDKKIQAWAHVKGKTRPRNATLRIYFYIDKENQKIVIAHAGEHLPTMQTLWRQGKHRSTAPWNFDADGNQIVLANGYLNTAPYKHLYNKLLDKDQSE